MVLSDEPLTTILSRYCKQAIPRLCPSKVRTNSQVVVSYVEERKIGIAEGRRNEVLLTQTLIVRSPLALTIYLSSKSTTLTAARCPNKYAPYGDICW